MFTVNCNSLLFILLPKIPQRYNFKMSLLFSENFEIKKKIDFVIRHYKDNSSCSYCFKYYK